MAERKLARLVGAKSQREMEQERAERERMRRRASRYHERLWRDHAIATGQYKGDKLPSAVLLKMREARSAHLLRSDLSAFDPSSGLGDPIATFPYKGKCRDGELMWCVHTCGSVTIEVPPDPDADF
jgi:hypothetical protein